jgi:hypothetical protein
MYLEMDRVRLGEGAIEDQQVIYFINTNNFTKMPSNPTEQYQIQLDQTYPTIKE